MRRKTTNTLFVLAVALLTAAGTFKALDHNTSAILLFIAAVVLFFITASFWLARYLSRLRTRPKIIRLKDLESVNQRKVDHYSSPYSYTNEVILGVSYYWQYYSPETGYKYKIKAIQPRCVRCGANMSSRLYGSRGGGINADLECPHHPGIFTVTGTSSNPFASITAMIAENITSGKWKSMVQCKDPKDEAANQDTA
jgi:hypothetical protein